MYMNVWNSHAAACACQQVVPVDSSAELLLEVIEDFDDGNKRDLFYPEFQSKHQDNNNNAADEQPLKKVRDVICYGNEHVHVDYMFVTTCYVISNSIKIW